jgi:hypothetical protein
MLYWLLSTPRKLKSNRLAMKKGQGANEGDWEHLSITARH